MRLLSRLRYVRTGNRSASRISSAVHGRICVNSVKLVKLAAAASSVVVVTVSFITIGVETSTRRPAYHWGKPGRVPSSAGTRNRHLPP